MLPFLEIGDLHKPRLVRNALMVRENDGLGQIFYFLKFWRARGIKDILLYAMNLKIGIVGMPNVGKSTLFQVLTRKNILNRFNCNVDK